MGVNRGKEARVARINTDFRFGKLIWATLAMGVVWLSLVSPSWGQSSTTSPPRARNILLKARDAFARGDYETAAFFYQKVELLQSQLTPVEQKDLVDQVRQNNLALKEQRIGRAQLHQAEEALDKRDRNKAQILLKMADTNQYLTLSDRKTLNSLQDRLNKGQFGPQNSSPQPKPAPLAPPPINPHPANKVPVKKPLGNSAFNSPIPKTPVGNSSKPKTPDYDTLLRDARSALKRGDLATAESLARQAKKAHTGIVPSWVRPWHDSPDKILRDVQKARQPAPPPRNTDSQSGGIAPFKAVRNLFWKTSTPGPKSKPETKPVTTTNSKPNPITKSPLVQTGFQEKGPPIFPTPKVQEKEPPKNGPPLFPAPGPVVDKKQRARKLIQEGYKALNAGDLEKARQLAEEAKQLRPGLAFWEDNPEKLLADIDRHSPLPSPKLDPTVKSPDFPTLPETPEKDARELLKKGREALKQGNLEEADRLCIEAASVPNANWRLFELDTPTKLRNDIQTARTARDREKAKNLLAAARKLFTEGKLQQAKELAWKAKRKHGDHGIFHFGDHPDALLKEIHQAELAQGP